MGAIVASGVSFAIKGRRILDGVALEARPDELVGLLGPNGSGKTTLLRVLAGLRTPQSGSVRIDGVDVHDHSRRAIARRLAVVEQDTLAHVDLTARQVVEIGRTPFRGRFDALTDVDDLIVDTALARVDIVDLQQRTWHTLSGGEKQRVQLARALAQEPREILLDEPTNHLDVRHQLELLELLRAIDVTCVIALHDLNLAARYCDTLVVLDGGGVAAAGPPESVLTVELLTTVYGVDATVDVDPASGAVRVGYRGPRRSSDQ